jgi:SAM-dependent methyltransferase
MANFYQAAYSEGFTTTLPSEAKLKALLETSFVGTEKDISHYLAVLDALGIKTGARVLDFGCSWGYGTWQLAKAGFSAEAVEISAPRCDFARKRLGIDAHTSLAETHGQFDCVFSSHVLEHVSDPRSTVLQLLNKVGTGGVLVVFTPNGSLQFRDEKPKSWRSCWGLVHPTMMDDQFYERTFRSRPYYLASSPYKLDAIESWRAAGGQTVGNLIGDELLCVVAGEK